MAVGGSSTERELGLPLPRGMRMRIVRRMFVKLLWPLFRNQVAVNNSVHEALNAMSTELDAMRPRLDRIDGDLEHHSSVLSRHETKLIEINGLDEKIALVAERGELAQRQSFARHQDGMGALRGDYADLARQVREIAQLENQIADIRIRLASSDLLVREIKKSRPELPSPEQIAQLPTAFDELYGAFEDAFRGSEQIIADRVSHYVDDILRAPEVGSVLDIGCGRGEWLQILKDAKIPSYGVEINAAYAERCQQRGLDVRLIDVMDHLKEIPEGSLRAITAIQMVEHIEVDALIELIDRAIVALAPGGVLIFETPNPDNLTVGASSFYIDPTHERPLPPALLGFLVDCRGMVDVEIRQMNRPELEMLQYPTEDNPWNADIAKLINVINSRIYGAQDYAIVARRP